ncbi:MBL fold metallo-hydrolase [Leclercia adecarboxylata]|uniref:MBL fold metallo-hydrolase n=1 Tax=Leclercia adecarboxylata TaxID=83655 RepID=UPI00111B67A7|nr:MBL fold metallo-hydrolase [Leclercia adecarboxylata]QCZ29451.1 MBL fold metallo-hydrolase [Leclercia adecarboxylata]
MSPVHTMQAPAVNRKKVGDMVVTMLSDGYLDASFELLSGITGSQAEAVLQRRGVSVLPRMNINVYVVQNGEQTILVDSGAGNFKGWGGRLPVALAAAGIDPLQIDTILLTHAHPDHIGGLAGPLQTPHFRNVERLFVHQDELAFWRNKTVQASAPDGFKPSFSLAQNAFAAYDEKLVPFRQEDILPGIQAVALPGHTPGHSGYVVGDEKASLLIWGDIVHFPHIQVEHPEVTIAFDSDPVAAAATRKRLLERVATDKLTVSGMHFNAPVTATVSQGPAQEFALQYDGWSPAV